MSTAKQTVIPLQLSCVGNTAISSLLKLPGLATALRGSGLDAGGFIKLGTATSVDVVVKDGNGKTIYTGTGLVADTVIAPTAGGVTGPITVTATNVNNSSTGTFSVFWWVRK